MIEWRVPEQSRVSQHVPPVLESLKLELLSWALETETLGRAGLSMAQQGCDSRGGSDSGAGAVSHPLRASLHPWTLPPADAHGNKSRSRRREWGVGEDTGVPSQGCGG